MIGFLKGKLLATTDTALLVDVSGVGYDVQVGAGSASWGEVGETVALWIHTHVREDQITLFGFREMLQKKIFLILIGITGIGPKLALAATSLLEPAELVDAVTFGNTAVLRTIPGVGKKMADRMVLELKDKLGLMVKQTEWQAVASGGGQTQVYNDLHEALSGLGFSDAQIRNVVKLLRRELEDRSVEINELLKLALQRIKNC